MSNRRCTRFTNLCLLSLLAILLAAIPNVCRAQGEVPSIQWVRFYTGTGGSNNDQARALATDNSGNVYVTGSSWNGNNWDYATVKYDLNGTQQWVARYDAGGNDEARAIAVDSSGNVYVTGRSVVNNQADIVTIKYDSNGNELWNRRYIGSGGLADEPFAIALDSFGSVYITGQSWVIHGPPSFSQNFDYITLKYRSDGILAWVTPYNGRGDGPDTAKALVVSAGYVYVTGVSRGTSVNGDEYATVKYNADSGNQVWAAYYNGTSNYADSANAISVDSNGNVYVTGSTSNGTNMDYGTVKYDSNGNQLWARTRNGTGNGNDEPNALALANGVVITGYSVGSGTGKDYLRLRYDASGTLQWEQRYNGGTNSDDVAQAVVAPDQVYITGWADGQIVGGSNYDVVTIKYDLNSSSQIWLSRYDRIVGQTHYNDWGVALTKYTIIANDTCLYVTGYSGHSSSATLDDYLTLKIIESAWTRPQSR